MINVVGVRFKNAGKVYYFDPGDMEFSDGEKVIVETVRGLECGEVVGEPRLVPDEEVAQPLKKVIRKATPDDELVVDANREKERRAFKICLEKIAAHGLPMKLVDVEYTFDGSKIIFFFTADGRVDFRELVKDLAGVFRTRIELRQIGVRDEAKMIGGLGPCGRPLCCATFLRDFEPVSIRMAKDQNLSLNPTKISGICGRLMCCLKYEHDVYKTLRQALPPVGSEIDTEAGRGKITELDVLKGIACVKIEDGKTVHVDVRRQNGASRYPVVTGRWSGPCAPCVPCDETGQLEAAETEPGTEPDAESETEVQAEAPAQTATKTGSETGSGIETDDRARGAQAPATAAGGTTGDGAGAAASPRPSGPADPRRRRGERGGRREGDERREGRDQRRDAAASGRRAGAGAGDGRGRPVPSLAHADVAAAAERAGAGPSSAEAGPESSGERTARAAGGSEATNPAKPADPRRRAPRRRWKSGGRPGQEAGRARPRAATGQDAAHRRHGAGGGGRAGRENRQGAVRNGSEAQDGVMGGGGRHDASSDEAGVVPRTHQRQNAAPGGGERGSTTAANPRPEVGKGPNEPGRVGSRVRRRGARRHRRASTPTRETGQVTDDARLTSGTEKGDGGKHV